MSFNSKDTKGYWAVNGTALYKPQGCEITHENYVGSNSGRTEDGVMHIDWLRRDLRKVTIKYNAMTGNEMDELVGLVQGKEYTATFRDRGKTSKNRLRIPAMKQKLPQLFSMLQRQRFPQRL